MHFSKSLAKYYKRWYEDCLKSAIYCRSKGDEKRAKDYEADAEKYAQLISEHSEAIEFFSIDGNAHKMDRLLPEKFRGYK